MIIIALGAFSKSEKDFINQLYKNYHLKLFHISFRILGSHTDAEEAVSTTFLKIIDYLEKISRLPCPQIAPYCVIVVKNESINILRRKKREACLGEADYSDGNNSDEKLYDRLDKEQLLTVISQLSDEERYLIQLRYASEMGYREIADLIGISEETAKKRGQRILKKLRSLYEEGEKNGQHI